MVRVTKRTAVHASRVRSLDNFRCSWHTLVAVKTINTFLAVGYASCKIAVGTIHYQNTRVKLIMKEKGILWSINMGNIRSNKSLASFHYPLWRGGENKPFLSCAPFACVSKRLRVQNGGYENETKLTDEFQFIIYHRLVFRWRQLATSAPKHHSRFKSMSKHVNNQWKISKVFTSCINEIPKLKGSLERKHLCGGGFSDWRYCYY